MVVLVVLEQAIIDIEHKEQLGDATLALDQVLGQDGLSFVEVQVPDLDLEAELLGQVGCLDHEVPLAKVVDSAHLVVEERNLVQVALGVLEVVIERLILQVYGLGVALMLRHALCHLISHMSILVHRLKRALHQLPSLEQVVYLVREDRLAVDVPLDLEHELASSHPI